MTYFDRILAAWRPALADMLHSTAFRRIADGTLSRREYGAILRQVFHQVREHPQSLALLANRLHGERGRAMVKTLLKHAVSEAGHDELALADLTALGEDVSAIRSERPLPATAALVGFMRDQLVHGRAVGYLGYVFHLEFTPTAVGPALMRSLRTAGIPDEAQSFLRDHAEIDVAHNRLMERYVAELVVTEEDVDAVCYVAVATAQLYARMFDDAIATVQPGGCRLRSPVASA